MSKNVGLKGGNYLVIIPKSDPKYSYLQQFANYEDLVEEVERLGGNLDIKEEAFVPVWGSKDYYFRIY